jgi:hypothetical protein
MEALDEQKLQVGKLLYVATSAQLLWNDLLEVSTKKRLRIIMQLKNKTGIQMTGVATRNNVGGPLRTCRRSPCSPLPHKA